MHVHPSPRVASLSTVSLTAASLVLSFSSLASATAAVALPTSSSVVPAAAAFDTSSLQRLAVATQRVKLDNGLRVVMNVDHSSPSVAVCVTYDIGSRNEQPGRSGFAHLFEHMMFQGSANVAKGEHFTWISAKGGTLNGTTSSDRTNYFETLPASSLALGLWLEADRMKSLDVSQVNFENQRKVVQEEYRMRVSNAAYALAGMKLSQIVFGSYWPYAHPTIGSMADLDAAQLDWIRQFHSSYYAPNNAVLSITGDFDPDSALQLVHQYFDSAKPVQIPPYDPPAMPEQSEAHSATVQDTNAHNPGLLFGWAIPPNRTPEHYALELATLVLGGGESSRLHQLLVRDKGWASGVSVSTDDQRGPDQFTLRVILSEQGKVPAVTSTVRKEVDRLARSGPTEAELTKAKNQLLSYFLFGLEGNMARAQQLGSFELYYGDARLLTREVDAYLAVSASQVQQATAKFLTAARQNLVTVEPVGAPGSQPSAKTTQPSGKN
ncbi:MAG TPA: pitrilysin family protein [Polyangiaceae bacterium]|nr:pitrilysin family protein [Polyangiaceae bacterium]